MATLTTGPRLGSPASTGFKVWAKLDGAASVTLETKLPSATTWTLQDTQAVETAKKNTVVVEATGLEPATLYDYRIAVDAVVAATEQSMTMPTTGRFVVYHFSDFHQSDASVPLAWALTDWETNYRDAGVPGVISLLGDFTALLESTTADAITRLETQLANLCGTGLAGSNMPVMYQFDDWDWGGNNSSKDFLIAFESESDPEQEAIDMQDAYWRERPQPAAPSYGHHYEIASVPFIYSDSRSQRVPQTTSYPPFDNVLGNNGVGDCYGATQAAWLKTTLRAYGRRALVVFFSGDTWRDSVGTIGADGGPTGIHRDSVGVFYIKSRNAVIQEGMMNYGYESLNNLLVVSSDDHNNIMWDGPAGGEKAYTDYVPKPPFWLPFREVKVNSSKIAALVPPRTTFGDSLRYFQDEAAHDEGSCIRMDITSSVGGERVTMRMTWFDCDDGTILTWDSGDNADGSDGDFTFINGRWLKYESGVSDTQNYPPMNSPEPEPLYGKAYVDDVLGTLHTREMVARDDFNRLRRIDDFDERDRDDLKIEIRRRTEKPLEPVR